MHQKQNKNLSASVKFIKHLKKYLMNKDLNTDIHNPRYSYGGWENINRVNGHQLWKKIF